MKYVLIPLFKLIMILFRSIQITFYGAFTIIFNLLKLLWSFNLSQFFVDMNEVDEDIIMELTRSDLVTKYQGITYEVESIKDYILNGRTEKYDADEDLIRNP